MGTLTSPGRTAATGIHEVLVIGFVCVLPLVNVAGPLVILTPPAIAALMLFSWQIASARYRVTTSTLALFGLCVLCFLPWVWSASYVTRATLLHAASLVLAVALYFAAARTGIEAVLWRRGPGVLLRAYFLAMLATSAFIIFEAVASNLFGIDVGTFVPYIEVQDFEAKILGVYLRPRGFASEPGVMALYFDFGLFFVLPLLRKRRYLVAYLLVILPAYLALLSAASLLACAVAAVCLTLHRLWNRLVGTAMRIAVVTILVGAVSIPFWESISKAADEIVVDRVVALAGGVASQSGTERADRFAEILDVLALRPLGIGFGVTPGLEGAGGLYEGLPLASGQISLFGAIAVAGGPPAALAIVAIAVILIVRVARVAQFGPPIAAGAAAIAIHHLFVSEYWLPFFWFALAAAGAFAAHHRGVGAGIARRGQIDVEKRGLSDGVTGESTVKVV